MAKSSISGWVLGVLVLSAAAGGGWYYFQQAGEKPPEITTIPVTRGSLQQIVTATGAIQPMTSVEISSQVSGLVTEVLVDFNDVVKKGQVLARIDEATYKSKLAQAQAQLANTQANHLLVSTNTKRTLDLYQRQLVTEQEKQQAEAQLKQADAQLLIQTAAVENAQIDLSRCTLYSPIDGVVIDRQTEVGKTVAASLNAPLLFLIVNDLTKMEISAGVSEADIGNVKEGQEVTFMVDAFPGRPFRGTVAQIRNAPVTQSNVVTYGAIIEVDNSDLRLKPGMTANVSIITASRDDVLRVANSTLRVRVPDSLLVAAPSASAGAATADASASAPPPPRGGDTLADNGGRGDQPLGADGRGGRRGGGRGGRGGRGGGAGGGFEPQVLTRIVHKSVGTPEQPRVERVSVRLGISDGVNTEVLDGLAEGDAVVAGVNTPGAPAAQQAAGGNPFQTRGGGGFGGGGGGGRGGGGG